MKDRYWLIRVVLALIVAGSIAFIISGTVFIALYGLYQLFT